MKSKESANTQHPPSHILSPLIVSCGLPQTINIHPHATIYLFLCPLQDSQYESVLTLEVLLHRYAENKGVWRHHHKALLVHQHLLRYGSDTFARLSWKYARCV